jgi:hypothetical protein
MGDKIADGIRVKIAVVAVEIRTLGHHKTEVAGPWTPPIQHFTIFDVMIEAVNSQWEVCVHILFRPFSSLTKGERGKQIF